MNAIVRFFKGYGDTDKAEMRDIQQAFQTHCYPVEKELSPTTLQNITEKNEKELFPRYFQMDQHFSLPLAYQQDFKPDTALLNWKTKIESKSHLYSYIQEMLGYICENQCMRDKGFIKIKKMELFKEGYNYDPTNLFYEEFKCWLVELSKKGVLDENVLKSVNVRISYLSYIYDHKIFHPDNDRGFPRLARIKFIKDILEKNIKQLIEISIARLSSREHFNNLKIHSTSCLYAFVRFLFYFPRDTEDTPENFIMAEVRQPTLPCYQATLSTASGKLLQYLTNHGGFALIFPLNLPNFSEQENKLENILSNNFIKDDGTIVFPLTTNRVTLYNWYNDEKDKGYKSGIIEAFRKPELMKNFVKLHGLLQELCVFTLICDMLFELAGDGGDLLVYGYAASKVEIIIDRYKSLTKEISENLQALNEAAKEHNNDINLKKVKKYNKTWYENYKFIAEAYRSIEQELTACDVQIKKIEVKISQVNSPQYLQWIQRKLQFFSQCVDQFSHTTRLEVPVVGQSIDSDDVSSLIGNPFALVPNIADKPSIKQITLGTTPKEMAKQAKELVVQGQYEQALEVLNVAIETQKNIRKESDISQQPSASSLLFILFNSRARVFYELGSPGQAKKDLEKILRENPDDLMANGLMKKLMDEKLEDHNILEAEKLNL